MQRGIGLLVLFLAAGVSCTGSDSSTGPDQSSAALRLLTLPAPMVVGETYHLTLFDQTETDQSAEPSVVWSSSNTSAATVAAGVITATAEGTVQISAKLKGKTATTSITITRNTQSLSQDIFPNGILGFSSARNSGELDAYIVGPGGLQRVTTSDDQEQFDGWSPDGKRIAILRFPMNADAFSSHTVLTDGTDDILVSTGIVNWAPDWIHRGAVVSSQIAISNADGSGSHSVGPVGYFVQGPWWSRDG